MFVCAFSLLSSVLASGGLELGREEEREAPEQPLRPRGHRGGEEQRLEIHLQGSLAFGSHRALQGEASRSTRGSRRSRGTWLTMVWFTLKSSPRRRFGRSDDIEPGGSRTLSLSQIHFQKIQVWTWTPQAGCCKPARRSRDAPGSIASVDRRRTTQGLPRGRPQLQECVPDALTG